MNEQDSTYRPMVWILHEFVFKFVLAEELDKNDPKKEIQYDVYYRSTYPSLARRIIERAFFKKKNPGFTEAIEIQEECKHLG